MFVILFILEGLFNAYFIMVYGFVAGKFNDAFGGLDTTIGAFTKDYTCTSGGVIAAITTIVYPISACVVGLIMHQN